MHSTTPYMTIPRPFNIKYKLLTIALLALGFLSIKPAMAQVDYNYGINKKGFRLGLGVGLAALNTHYNSNPAQLVGIGSLDYDFNPYFSIGIEAQGGHLKGVDDLHHLYYKTSTDFYLDGNVNLRFGLGLITDFESHNRFQDAVKNIYIGAGVGRIRTNNTFTYNDDLAPYAPEDPRPIWQMWDFPFNVGTNIDLRLNGRDRFSINPNFQFTYVNDYYLDGYRTSIEHSHLKGFYNLTSIKLKYKF